jgi:hypothetical protein
MISDTRVCLIPSHVLLYADDVIIIGKRDMHVSD